MEEFKHIVALKEIPKHIYDKDSLHSHFELFDWLSKNIGKGNLLDETDGVWSRDMLEYSEDEQNIIQKFRFKNQADAVMFSLKWA